MSIIQIRNVIDETYIVSRHVKLNRVLDYEKKIYCLTNSKKTHLTIKLKKQLFKNSFKLTLTKFIDVFIFVFELILKLIIVNHEIIVKLSQTNFIVNAKTFVITTKSIISKISSINEIITTREIIVYDDELTRTKLKKIIDQFFIL